MERVRYLLGLARPSRSAILWVVFTEASSHLAALPIALGAMFIIDDLVPRAALSPVAGICLVLVLFVIIQALASWLTRLTRAVLNFHLSAPLYRRLMRSVPFLPVEDLESRRVFAWRLCFADVGWLAGISATFAQSLLAIVLSLTTTLPALLWISPTLGVILALLLPLGLIPTIRTLRGGTKVSARGLEYQTAYSSWCDEVVTKLELLQGYRIARDFRRQQRKLAVKYARFHLGPSLVALEKVYANRLLAEGLYVGAVGLGIFELMRGTLSVGGLVAFLTLARQFMSPLTKIPAMGKSLMEASPRLDRIQETLTYANRGAEFRQRLHDTHHAGIERIQGSIRFESVHFEYKPGTPVLSDVSFELKPGERVGLVGRSGAGKTTLVRLLARLAQPTAGRILVDDRELGDWGLSYNEQIGILFQDYRLLPGTIRENLAAMNPRASEEDMWEALELAMAADFLHARPDQLDSDVGGRGGAQLFSLGQRQRLLMAALFVRKPRLCLLDEATSALDVRNEERLLGNLMQFLEDRTAIIISHKLAGVLKTDRLLLLAEGRLIEDSTHTELLGRSPAYQRLYAQTAGTL